MNLTRLFDSRAQSVRGKISYSHNRVKSACSAFEINEEACIKVFIPRVIGTECVWIEFFDNYGCNSVYKTELKWQSTDRDCDGYETSLVLSDIGVGLYFYRIVIKSVFGMLYGLKNGEDVVFYDKSCPDRYFQLSVSDFAHTVDDKKYGGVIYHVFVDRFNRGGRSKRKEGTVLPDDWSIIPEYPEYPGAHLKNNTFYGGTLDGIREKLQYIADLGVSFIYLSPVFDSISNHKYDTGNYMEVDSMFGGDEALEDLIKEAKNYGIGIILDGVFNHTGADSIYFNKFGKYNSVGAYQSKDSPYYPWFDFQNHPDKYTCWWGIEILPRINPSVPECSEYFVGDGGVIEKYAKMGIAGLRLDVADELSDDFLERIKDKLSKHSQGSVLYGEVWEDASCKIAYGVRKRYYLGTELDGVMNYPIRTGIIKFLTEKETGPLYYALTDIINNAPPRVAHMQMNLLGTHDTERILTLLGGESSKGRTNEYLSKRRMLDSEKELATLRLKMAYTILATVPGIPAIFYGDEAGMEGYHDPFNRMPYPWGREDLELIDFYRMIGKIRRENPVYKKGRFRLLHLDKDILVFERYSDKSNNRFITVVNNSPEKLKLSSYGKLSFLTSKFKRKENQAYVIDAYTSHIIKANFNTEIEIN